MFTFLRIVAAALISALEINESAGKFDKSESVKWERNVTFLSPERFI